MNASDKQPSGDLTRRGLLRGILRGAVLAGLAALVGRTWRAPAAATRALVWQIDPAKCIQCGRCATACVMQPSAVKCVHAYGMCGYCKRCFGFFQPEARRLDETAPNQLCPTNALRRTFIEDPYFEYNVDEARCIGCALCVKGCGAFGNGSLFLQVRHDRCLNCNECRIARECPAGAFVRLPASAPYLLKDAEGGAVAANRPSRFRI